MTGFGGRGRVTRVKGLSDSRRLPRLGKIRLGIKKVAKSGKEYPAEVDYFVVPPEVAAIYGEKPKALKVMLPVDDQDVVFPQAYKAYGGNGLVKCEGNNETAMRRSDQDRESWSEIKCPCDWLDSKKCSLRAHLLVMLPEVDVGGIYQIDTGSKHSVIDVNSGIDYAKGLIGRAAMVPMILRRVPRKTEFEGKSATHYTLSLTLSMPDAKAIESFRDNPLQITYSVPEPEDVSPEHDDVPAVPDGIIDEEDVADAPSAEQLALISTYLDVLKIEPNKKLAAVNKWLTNNGHDRIGAIEYLTPAQADALIADLQKAESPNHITPEQIDELGAMLDEFEVPEKKFLGKFSLPDLASVPAEMFEDAKAEIRKLAGVTDQPATADEEMF